MNNWQAVKTLMMTEFKINLSPRQLRFWWFGAHAGLSDKRQQHRDQMERTINTWDVVVRLAILYTKKQMLDSGTRWNDERIVRTIYFLLWSTSNDKNDRLALDLWWRWASENRNRLESILSKKAKKSYKRGMKLAIKQGLEIIQKQLEEDDDE